MRNARLLAVGLSLLALLAPAACTHSQAPREQTTAQHPAPASVPASITPAPRPDVWWADQHARIVEKTARGNHHILFLGASIMERWETVGAEVWNWDWRPRGAVDCGIGGDRTQHVLWRLDHGLADAIAAPGNDFRWVVLNIGSNNTDTDSGADIARGVEAIIRVVKSKAPSARFIVTLFPRGEKNSKVRAAVDSANAILREHAGSASYIYMNIGSIFLDDQGEIRPDMMPDFIHPTSEGYRIWSGELLKAMQ